jgi:hypothetical protein
MKITLATEAYVTFGTVNVSTDIQVVKLLQFTYHTSFLTWKILHFDTQSLRGFHIDVEINIYHSLTSVTWRTQYVSAEWRNSKNKCCSLRYHASQTCPSGIKEKNIQMQREGTEVPVGWCSKLISTSSSAPPHPTLSLGSPRKANTDIRTPLRLLYVEMSKYQDTSRCVLHFK